MKVERTAYLRVDEVDCQGVILTLVSSDGRELESLIGTRDHLLGIGRVVDMFLRRVEVLS